MHRLTETLLDTIRQSLGLSIGTTRYLDLATGRHLWLVNARSADGAESWAAKAEDRTAATTSRRRLVPLESRIALVYSIYALRIFRSISARFGFSNI